MNRLTGTEAGRQARVFLERDAVQARLKRLALPDALRHASDRQASREAARLPSSPLSVPSVQGPIQQGHLAVSRPLTGPNTRHVRIRPARASERPWGSLTGPGADAADRQRQNTTHLERKRARSNRRAARKRAAR